MPDRPPRTALGVTLPRPPARTVGLLRRDHVVTRHPRYRAWERHQMVVAVRAGAVVLMTVLLLDIALLGPRAPVLVAINLPLAIVAGTLHWMLGRRRPLRRHPAVAAYLVGIVGIVGTLLPLSVASGLGPVMAAYVPIVILASALFIPWGTAAELGYLGLCLGVVVAFSLSPYAAALPGGAGELISVAAAASLTGLAGHQVVLRQRINVFQQQLQLSRLHQTARRQHRELEDLTTRLEVIARHDPLTGAGNRLLLREDLARLRAGVSSGGPSAAAVMIDIDEFKAYNDRHGHIAGDEVLRRVVKTIGAGIRRGDRVYRFGGEEFLVLLGDATVEQALVIADGLRDAVSGLAIPNAGNQPWQVITVSAGVAEVDVRAPADAWIGAADRALYASKAAGRNRVTAAAQADGGRSAA